MAAVMNAASNGLNQIFDLEIDRINKPLRPLPSGRLGLRAAGRFTAATAAAGLALAALVNYQCLIMALVAALLTACYSVPPIRTKRAWLPAALTIAIPRGTLLLVAGWSTVKSVAMPEPWLLGAVFGLFFLGATTTKDFSDIAGDRAEGCQTLPVRYGVRRAALAIAPFFVLPFPHWGILARAGRLSGNAIALGTLSVLLPVLGAAIALRIVRNPEELSQGENHISWKLIYLMAVLAYGGLALAYLIPPDFGTGR
jgi:4-hydroxybenzoate polyprenyltransferase